MQNYFRGNDGNRDSLDNDLRTACEGLVLISETDAPITPFAAGPATEVTAQTILQQTGRSPSEPIEERDFDAFFERVTTIRDWYGEIETERAKKFLDLEMLLKQDLRERKVFRIGRIRLDIYAVGLDKDDNLKGVSKFAVET